jgi:hypothetical protein
MNDRTETPERRSLLGRWLLGHVRAAGLVLVAAAAVVGPVLWLGMRPPEWRVVQDATMKFLRQEQLVFLVTDRVVTRLDVVLKEGNVLLGWRESVLIGTVSFLCGTDLSKLTPDDVAWEDGMVVITVPDPEVLEVVVDTGSLALFNKRSGLIALKDQLERRDVRGELEKQLEGRARGFVEEEGLLPKRDDMVRRLNEWAAPLLSSQVRAAVEFR